MRKNYKGLTRVDPDEIEVGDRVFAVSNRPDIYRQEWFTALGRDHGGIIRTMQKDGRGWGSWVNTYHDYYVPTRYATRLNQMPERLLPIRFREVYDGDRGVTGYWHVGVFDNGFRGVSEKDGRVIFSTEEETEWVYMCEYSMEYQLED